MTKVLIMCVAGGTTSMVASRTTDAIKKKGIKDITIEAMAMEKGKQVASEYEFLLCGPHVAFMMDEFKKLYPNKIVSSVPPLLFGRLDGAGILELIQKEIEDHNNK